MSKSFALDPSSPCFRAPGDGVPNPRAAATVGQPPLLGCVPALKLAGPSPSPPDPTPAVASPNLEGDSKRCFVPPLRVVVSAEEHERELRLAGQLVSWQDTVALCRSHPHEMIESSDDENNDHEAEAVEPGGPEGAERDAVRQRAARRFVERKARREDRVLARRHAPQRLSPRRSSPPPPPPPPQRPPPSCAIPALWAQAHRDPPYPTFSLHHHHHHHANHIADEDDDDDDDDDDDNADNADSNNHGWGLHSVVGRRRARSWERDVQRLAAPKRGEQAFPAGALPDNHLRGVEEVDSSNEASDVGEVGGDDEDDHDDDHHDDDHHHNGSGADDDSLLCQPRPRKRQRRHSTVLSTPMRVCEASPEFSGGAGDKAGAEAQAQAPVSNGEHGHDAVHLAGSFGDGAHHDADMDPLFQHLRSPGSPPLLVSQFPLPDPPPIAPPPPNDLNADFNADLNAMPVADLGSLVLPPSVALGHDEHCLAPAPPASLAPGESLTPVLGLDGGAGVGAGACVGPCCPPPPLEDDLVSSVFSNAENDWLRDVA